MNLLIFGASGATGVQLVQQALAGGYKVTAFVRDVRKLRQSHPNLSIVQGNVKDADAVRQAVKGQDVVISTLGARHVFQFDPVVVNGLANIVNAMDNHHVDRLIYLSTLGVAAARRQAGFMIRILAPTLLRHEIRGHEMREQMIQASPLQWTIVRAPVLTNNPLTGNYRMDSRLVSTRFVTSLSRADVAHCLLSQVQNRQYLRKPVSVMA